MGAAEQPAVAVRELVETKAAEPRIPSARGARRRHRLTAVNLLIPLT